MSTNVIRTLGYATPGCAQTPSLLDLFGLKSADICVSSPLPADHARRELWAADTHHRARNLAQMFIALGSVAPRMRGAIDNGKVAYRAALLADAYLELASDGASDTMLPCGPILERIVVGLVRLFAEGVGPLDLQVSVDRLLLPRDERRALVLIASELVINALKYAFTPGEPGKLSVSLGVDEGSAWLNVQDEGRGLTGHEAPGDGIQILDQLAALLGASIVRMSPDRGLNTEVRFPRW